MLRKTLALASLAGLFGLGAFNVAQAQGLPPDDGGGFEIGIEEPADEGGLFENLSQYLGATAGATSGSSDAVEKSIQAVNVVVDLPRVAGIKTAVSFDVGNYENVYSLELSEDAQQNLQQCQNTFGDPNSLDTSPNSGPFQSSPNASEEEDFYFARCDRVIDDEGNYLSPTTERTVDDSFAVVTEGYLQWEPTSFATLRVGRQPIVLGQFEVFSPLMFTVPMKATGTKTKTNKADMSYAQDGLQLSLFPLPQLEVSLTNIPKMRIDEANEKRFEEFALLKGDFMNFMPENGAGPGVDPNEELKDIGDSSLSVVRLIYFGDRFTIGVTSMEGAETNEDPLREARLEQVDCQDYFSSPAAVPAFSDCGQSPYMTYALDEDQGLRFAETETMAIEFSLRLTSKLSFIVEQTIVETEKELDMLPFGGNEGFKPTAYNPADPQNGVDLLPTYQELFTQNDRKPYVDVEITMQSAGFVYKGDRWLINFQLAQRTMEGANANAERWLDALDPSTYEGDDEEDDILPILNAVRLLGDEKQGYAGFGFGSFGQNFGFGLSVGWRYFEKLEVGLFGGMALDVTGADEIEAEGYETPDSDTYASFGINYLF